MSSSDCGEWRLWCLYSYGVIDVVIRDFKITGSPTDRSARQRWNQRLCLSKKCRLPISFSVCPPIFWSIAEHHGSSLRGRRSNSLSIPHPTPPHPGYPLTCMTANRFPLPLVSACCRSHWTRDRHAIAGFSFFPCSATFFGWSWPLSHCTRVGLQRSRVSTHPVAIMELNIDETSNYNKLCKKSRLMAEAVNCKQFKVSRTPSVGRVA